MLQNWFISTEHSQLSLPWHKSNVSRNYLYLCIRTKRSSHFNQCRKCFFPLPETIFSNYKALEILHRLHSYSGWWKQTCILIEHCSRGLPPCDVTASIWDPYFVYPLPKMPSRTNFPGNAAATTCQLRACQGALSPKICKRWKSGGSGPVLCQYATDARGHKCVYLSKCGNAHMRYWGRVFFLAQVKQWSSERKEELGGEWELWVLL